MCESGIFRGDIYAFKVDQGVQRVDAAQALECVASMCNELRDLIVDGIVEGEELFGVQIWPRELVSGVRGQEQQPTGGLPR